MRYIHRSTKLYEVQNKLFQYGKKITVIKFGEHYRVPRTKLMKYGASEVKGLILRKCIN